MLKEYARSQRHGETASDALALWIDKFCGDSAERELELGLACLPIYLMSCKHFVILAGPEWFRSLWAMFELFVFVEMGGSLDNVFFYALPELVAARKDWQEGLQEASGRRARPSTTKRNWSGRTNTTRGSVARPSTRRGSLDEVPHPCRPCLPCCELHLCCELHACHVCAAASSSTPAGEPSPRESISAQSIVSHATALVCVADFAASADEQQDQKGELRWNDPTGSAKAAGVERGAKSRAAAPRRDRAICRAVRRGEGRVHRPRGEEDAASGHQ